MQNGKLIGIGFSAFIEACGIAPSKVVGHAWVPRAGLYESASIRVHPTGKVQVYSQDRTHTAKDTKLHLHRLLPTELGIDLGDVEVVHGDTGSNPIWHGYLRFSRSLAVGGSAIVKALDTR